MALVNIYNAVTALVAVQESIALDDPPVRVRRAYAVAPPQMETIAAALPAWTNTWRFLNEVPSGALRRRAYEINMRLHVALAASGDNSRATDLALRFLEAVHVAFGQKNADGIGGLTLVGDVGGVLVPTVSVATLRGTGGDTVAVFGEGSVRTIGLDLVLDIEVSDGFEYS